MNADQLEDLHAEARAARRRAQSALDHFRDGHLGLPPRKLAQLLWLEAQLIKATEQETRARIYAEQGKRGFLGPVKEQSNENG